MLVRSVLSTVTNGMFGLSKENASVRSEAQIMDSVPEPSRLDWAPWPTYSEEQIQAVAEVLASGKVNQWTGSEVRTFEEEYSLYLGRRHAIAVMNGTSALELALKALGVGPGDEVITTPRSFIATASAIVLQGARPVFADVDRDSGNITAATIEPKITPKTKAILVVHLGGWPANMGEILQLAAEHRIRVVEDCAQAHGAEHQGEKVGSFGDVAAFSFCQDKIITTGGEGGLIALDAEDHWHTAWSYKDHGKNYNSVFKREHPPGFRWLHDSFGTNWRMTEMQAVLGRLQLRDLSQTIGIRNENASILRKALLDSPAVRVPVVDSGDVHAYYKLYAYVVPGALKTSWSRDRIQAELTEAGLPVTSGSCSEMYKEHAFVAEGIGPECPLPVAHELGETALMLQVHPGLTAYSLERASSLIRDVLNKATR